MAIVQVLDSEFIGAGLNAQKIYRIDPIESEGSLILFDASKLTTTLTRGVITTIPNLFNENAKKITGSDSHMDFFHSVTNSQYTRLERSTKGGIHYVVNPSLNFGVLEDYDSGYLRGIGGAKDYMRIHCPDSSQPHTFYVSLWYRYTTPSSANTSLMQNPEGGNAAYVSNYSHNWNYNLERVYNFFSPAVSSVGNYRVSTESYDTSSSTPPTTSTRFNLFSFGPNGLNGFGYEGKKYSSVILYRAYVEDLTISGRTYDEVDEIDELQHGIAFAEGGRFYNDTWSTPSTLF